jgi:hypothetical protein
MLPVGFEPTISAGKWPQTSALDCMSTGTGDTFVREYEIADCLCDILASGITMLVQLIL